jgi:hypothetical protein
MLKHFLRGFVLVVMLLMLALNGVLAQEPVATEEPEASTPVLLTDPFLQLPTEDGVHVVWFTEFEGSRHVVTFGEDLDQEVEAETIRMSRLFEDQESRVGEQTENGQLYTSVTARDIWRHEAVVSGISGRVPYYVTSIAEDGTEVTSDEFSLAPLPEEGQPLRILLTSDHQLKEMTPANMQMVEQTVGQVDAVFFAGDLQNIPDRASEWFDDNRGFAFFPGLQGNAEHTLNRTIEEDGVTINTTRTYYGGQIIQNAPLFPVIGNHEVMGRYNLGNSLGTQFNDPRPRAIAEARYEEIADLVNPDGDEAVREQWILDNSFNTITYEEIFTLPGEGPAGERYYAIQFGDVYLIGLYGTRIWRSPDLGDGTRGKFREALSHLNIPDQWGWGEFIFEDMADGSEQYDWLVEQLDSEAFQNSPIKIVMFHQPVHGVGDNSIPVFAHPEQIIDRAEDGSITGVRYEYPLESDVFVRDVEPLLNEAGVNLVHNGHSHVWYRVENEDGLDFLETSNVGNNYGCYLDSTVGRAGVPNDPRYDAANYPEVGDPHGLEPIMPSLMSPMQNDEGVDLPCVASNEITVFSILDTETGVISSYYFDTRDPMSEPMLFDEFSITED